MATRLLSESLIRKRFPHLRYVRVHTLGKHTATIYAWNDQLELDETDRIALKRFASTHLIPYVCYKIKEYSMLQSERVPPADEVPEVIQSAAMNRSLDLEGIVKVMNGMFSGGTIAFNEYNPWTGTVYMNVNTPAALTGVEKELIHRYLYELIPLGATVEVAYGGA